jgi:hypothetical protein
MLKNTYTVCWIWSLHLLNVTPLDYLLLAYGKDWAYAPYVSDLPMLWAHTHNVAATVTPDMLDKTWSETEYIFRVLQAINGKYIEVSWNEQIVIQIHLVPLPNVNIIFI